MNISSDFNQSLTCTLAMKRIPILTIALTLIIGVTTPVLGQEEPSSYPVGNPVGVPISPNTDQSFEPVSSNVTVYGAIYSAESCTYDSERDVLVVPNRGAPQSVRTNDAWISLINHDGSVHTPRWIGVHGIGFDPEGRIVVVNYGNDEVLTFSRDGELLKTETAAQPGGDGLVIMPDGTKYTSSVAEGGISRIRPDGSVELIARNIPSAASMCYDPKANQLVVPMNPNNGLAFVELE